jgi:hypothetical protein
MYAAAAQQQADTSANGADGAGDGAAGDEEVVDAEVVDGEK